jgi:3-hydroxyisobutyrate dehydrogenase
LDKPVRYGFVGLGNLGVHLASSLARAGIPVSVFDLNVDSTAPAVSAGAVQSDSLEALAASCDALITCLPSPTASQKVLDQALPMLRPGSTWIEMSTNDFVEVEILASKARERQVETLVCPVTGGVHLAANGKITVLVGGIQQIFEQHRPALEAMGGRVIYLGGIEQAAVTKVVTNMLAFIHLIAAGEALMLCAKAGVDLGAAFEGIAASSGTSFVHETEGQLILNGSYDVGFTMELACKDAGFALDYAQRYGVPLRLAGLMQQIFLEGRDTFGAQAQSTMIVKLLEDIAGVPLRAPGFPAKLVAPSPTERA